MRVLLASMLIAVPAAAMPLASDRAEADLACAAFLAWRADHGRPVEAAPTAQSALFARAMSAESAETGTDPLDLLGALQDRMRVIQDAYQRAEESGFALLDGLAVRAEDLGGLEETCPQRVRAPEGPAERAADVPPRG